MKIKGRFVKRNQKTKPENPKKILYIHEFMSSANSHEINKLKDKYWWYEFITPELTADPTVAIPQLNQIIQTEQPCLIIGYSLGGFYALMTDSGNIPVIVVNPCVNPYEHMKLLYVFNASKYEVIKTKI